MNNFIVDTQPAVEILVLWYYGMSKTTSLFFNKTSSFYQIRVGNLKIHFPLICLQIYIYINVCQYLYVCKLPNNSHFSTCFGISSNILNQITQILNHKNILDQIFFSYLLKIVYVELDHQWHLIEIVGG